MKNNLKNNKEYEEAKSKLEQISVLLLKQHSYVGYVFQNLNRYLTNDPEKNPTAFVTFRNGKFEMGVDVTFLNSLSFLEGVDVVRHEILHLLFDHIQRIGNRDPYISNVAQDFSCNSWLENLPKKTPKELYEQFPEYVKTKLSYDDFCKKYKKQTKDGKINTCLKAENYGLPERLTCEEYYHLIMQNPDLKSEFEKKPIDISQLSKEEQDQLAEDIKNGKVRITFGEGQHKEIEEDMISSQELKNVLQDAMNRCKNFGDLPGEIQRKIHEILTKSNIDWKYILKQFVFYASEAKKKITRKRRNRRYGITYPGTNKEYFLNVCTYVDTSGSIGEEDLSIFLNEINSIYKDATNKIRIMAGDTKTHNNYLMKKTLNSDNFNLGGGGGTDASVWLNDINKEEIDCAIILTDGCFDFNLDKPKYPVLWCLSTGGYTKEEFEKVIPFGKVIQIEKGNR